MDDILASLPDDHFVLHVAAEHDTVAAIARDADGAMILVRCTGASTTRVPWPHRGVSRIALVDGALVAQIDRRIVRIDADGRRETLGTGLGFAASMHGLVVARDEGLSLLARDGTKRALIDLGTFPREVEIVDRSGARVSVSIDAEGQYVRDARRHRTPPVFLVGAGNTDAIAATETGVVFRVPGGVEALPELRFVPWEGAVPRCIVREPDVDGVERWIDAIAPHGRGIAMVLTHTKNGARLACELWCLEPPTWTPRSIRIEGTTTRALAADGSRLVHQRAIGDDRCAIDLLVRDAWVELARDVTSVDVACDARGVVYGRGAAIVRRSWTDADDAPSPAVAALLDAIRAAGGKYETTTVGGKPAIKITRADGSRQIKPVGAGDLAELQRRLS